MKLSINTSIINKNENNANQSKNFVAADVTPQQLAAQMANGYALSYQFKDNHRKANNFICSDFIGADFDSGMTLDEALSEPFFKEHACLLYTTASHTAEEHRFRVIFQTPYTITDKEQLRAAQRGLSLKFRSDSAATDPARQFYGSRNCTAHIFDKTLSQSALDELILLGSQPRQSDSIFNSGAATTRSSLYIDVSEMISLADGTSSVLYEIPFQTRVYCPFHSDKNPSAFTTRSKRGVPAIHCASCQQTFWPTAYKPDDYNFFEFDDLAIQLHEQPRDIVTDESGTIDFELPNHNRVFSDRFLPVADMPLFDGITLIKSPKGSGKTEYLKSVIEYCNERHLRVLMIGHRRALLRALSERLGLLCYLDIESDVPRTRHLAISIDSLSTLLEPEVHKYQVVILDESEQVFSHLIAETMEHSTRLLSFQLLLHYINVARQVIALDADLNLVTLHAIDRKNDKNPLQNRRLILNHFPVSSRTLELYKEEEHLIGQIFEDIQAGLRLFICCNSKARVEKLVDAIVDHFGSKLPLYSITSENSMEPETRELIASIKTEILKYQVVVVSPALGTGIDITFNNGECLINGVYGIFNPLINTHYDIDQQLSRVRNPGFVRIWINPQRFAFETEVDPIHKELATSGLYPNLRTGFNRSGQPTYNWTDSFTLLHSHILASQRASKNNLRQNLIELRKYNGWSVTEILPSAQHMAIGGYAKKRGELIRSERLAQELLSAKSITWDEAQQLIDARKREVQVSVDEQRSLERYFIEGFYHEPLTHALIATDNEGYYRHKLRLLESVLEFAQSDRSRPGSIAHKHPNEPYQMMYMVLSAASLFTATGELDQKVIFSKTRLANFATYCRRNKAKIERVLEIPIRRDLEQKPLQQLNSFLDYCGLQAIKTNTFSSGQGKIYEYGLGPQGVEQALEILGRRKATRETKRETPIYK